MLLNISDVLTSEGKVTTKDVSFEMDTVDYRGDEFLILDKKPIQFTFTNIGVNEVKAFAHVSIIIQMACDRCLKAVNQKVEFDISRELSAVTEDYPITEDDDLDVMEGYQLNVEKLIYNEILMNWPLKVLCKLDCKGICKQCGKDLNLGECGCNQFVPDPRMAAIKDIFNANKEV